MGDVAALLERLDANPFDGAAWRLLLLALESSPSESHVHYARALALFPTSGPVILAAARARLSDGDISGADALLQAHLLRAPYPPLWAFYCDFVESTKASPAVAAVAAAVEAGDPGAIATAKAAAADARSAVLAAYEFATGRIGAQWGSDALWRGFAAYCTTLPSDTVYAATQAREWSRKALVAGSQSAMPAVRELWDAYCMLERTGSQEKLAEKLISDHASSHATAAAVSRERAVLWVDLDFEALPVPPPSDEECSALGVRGSNARAARAAHDTLAAAWKRMLGYELSNPLHVSADAHTAIVRGLFRAAVAGPLRFVPDVWADFIAFEGGTDTIPGAEIASEACTVLPTSTTLALSIADAAELAGRNTDADGMYVRLLAVLHAVAAAGGRVRDEAAAALQRAAAGAHTSSAVESTDSADEIVLTKPEFPVLAAIDAIASGGSVDTAFKAAGLARPAQGDQDGCLEKLSAAARSVLDIAVVLSSSHDASEAAAAVPLVYILHQRFARRTGGVDAARTVFAAARRSPYVTPAVYIASARLEFFANGRTLGVARNMLEAARKKWPSDIHLALSAIDFLSTHDDASSARVFIEAALEAFGGVSAPRALWDRLLALELAIAPGGGSAAAVDDVEKRRAAAHPSLTGPDARLLLRGVHRWGVGAGGAPPATRVDADALRRHPAGPFATLPLAAPVIGVESMDAAAALPALHGGPVTLAGDLGIIPARMACADGFFLQGAPALSLSPLTSSLISHVPHASIAAAAVSAVAIAADKMRGAAPPPRVVVEKPPSLPNTLPSLRTAPGPTINSAAALLEPPVWARALLSRLPAYDATFGPLPDVNEIVRTLAGGAPAAIPGGGGHAGVKRRRE